MNCETARELMLEAVLSGTGLSEAVPTELRDHLCQCEACRRAATEFECLARAIRHLPPPLLEEALQGTLPGYSLETRTTAAPLKCRLPRSRSLTRIFVRAAAVAACLALLGVGAWRARIIAPAGTASISHPAQTTPEQGQIIGTVVADGDAAPQQLAAGDLVSTQDGHWRTVRIWNRHEMLVHPGTQVSVRPDDQGGCMVAVSRGRVRVSVHRAPDEGLFRVTTAHATLVVTGTVFDVLASGERTQMEVLDGTVLFRSRSGLERRVNAGQTFATDGLVLTEAHGLDSVACVSAQLADPFLAARPNRDYQERFAPLLRLRDYLETRAVRVDERELIGISADLWCVQKPKQEASGSPAYLHRRAGLERASSLYGHETQWTSAPNARVAADRAEQALDAGELVLAFGLPGKPCVVIDRDRISYWRTRDEDAWSYRFLGEDQEVRCPLCVIRPSPGRTRSPKELVSEALAEMKSLVSGLEDPGYHVGREAINSWAENFVTRTVLDSGLQEMISLLARLGPGTADALCRLDPGVEASYYREMASSLNKRLESTLLRSDWQDGACGRGERAELAASIQLLFEPPGP